MLVRADGEFEVLRIEIGLVKIEQRLSEEGVIVEEAGNGGVAVAIAAQEDVACCGVEDMLPT